MEDLLKIMRRLRAPDGCPWDREQTHHSLRPYLLEEAAETVDAISGEQWAELPAELGDVLLQVAFHSVIAEEAGTFGYAQVERSIVDKLIRRHPHVFAQTNVSGSAEVVQNWQAIKRQERGGRPRTAAERIPAGLGALAREARAQQLSAAGSAQREGKVLLHGALEGLTNDEAGIGRLLSAVVALALEHGLDPELALRAHTGRTLENLPPEVA
ncbi:MazG family protein [Deinococcus sp.]|uniref:MazG family protein n=1 Tax=Deinococcus sp. TaxID=47478 RepID=UPI003CC586EC